MREYDLIADWYASERDHATGVAEVTEIASSLAPRSRILDIGCGNGIPITRALLNLGQRVVGLDSSAEMLRRFRRNCPGTPAAQGIVQSCPFANGTFDAAVAWGVMFHLTPEDQSAAIASVARVLKSGALFLFTAGDEDKPHAKLGTMKGVTFQYFSFSVDKYRRILRDQDFSLINTHTDSGNNTYYLAKKLSAAGHHPFAGQLI